MAIRPKWLKDISSVLFSAYYMLYVAEGDEVVSASSALYLIIIDATDPCSYVASELYVLWRCCVLHGRRPTTHTCATEQSNVGAR